MVGNIKFCLVEHIFEFFLCCTWISPSIITLSFIVMVIQFPDVSYAMYDCLTSFLV